MKKVSLQLLSLLVLFLVAACQGCQAPCDSVAGDANGLPAAAHYYVLRPIHLPGELAYAPAGQTARSGQPQRAQTSAGQITQPSDGHGCCLVDEQDKLIFSGSVEPDRLEQIRRQVCQQAQAERNDLFRHPRETYVTVCVVDPTNADKLPSGRQGYYDIARHSITAAQTGVVLAHEFTHALHHADQEALAQAHPIWVNEGLATLFESSRIQNGHIYPLQNARLGNIKDIVAAGQAIPWSRFFRIQPEGYMQEASICYPEGRYVMMYLYEKGLLRRWYDLYTTTYNQDPTGGLAMERTFGKDLSTIERDWLAWVRDSNARQGQEVRVRQQSSAAPSSAVTALSAK